MKRILLLALAGATTALGCSDLDRVTGIDTSPQSVANHGNIPQASVTTSAVSGGVLVSWTWSDTDDWDLVSFEVTRNGGAKRDGGNAKPYTPSSVISRSVFYSGGSLSDTYCVAVMAKYMPPGSGGKGGKPSITNHSVSCGPVGSTFSGLLGEYWNINQGDGIPPTISGTPDATRADAQVDFTFAHSVDPNDPLPAGIGTDVEGGLYGATAYFAARWSGQLTSTETGIHMICVLSDDGFRLYVTDLGTPAVESWQVQNIQPTTVPTCANVALVTGVPTDIQLDYFNEEQVARVHLLWNLPSGSSDAADATVIPSSALTGTL